MIPQWNHKNSKPPITLMRVMLFFDVKNFEGSLRECNPQRFLDIGRVHYFLIEKVNDLLKDWNLKKSDIIRAYAYTGEYTDSFLSRVKTHYNRTTNPAKKQKINNYLSEVTNRKKPASDKFISQAKRFNFFEIKTLPLRYDPDIIRAFQKGVDVELAVDLVSHAYKDSYDVAIVCSGDIDLQRSFEQVKSLGKRVILVSHPNCMSKDLRKSVDYFINLAYLTPPELDKISHNFVPSNNQPNYIAPASATAPNSPSPLSP